MIYSIVIYLENEEKFKKCLSSILQQYFSHSKIELIIFDITDSLTIEKYLKDTCDIKYTYEKLKNNDLFEVYNRGLSQANGKYINFINSSTYYKDRNLLTFVKQANEDLIAVQAKYYESDTDILSLYKMQPEVEMLINLEENPFKLHLALEAYFINREIIDFKFSNLVGRECCFSFLLKMLEKVKAYYYLAEVSIVTSEPFETNTSKNSLQYSIDWYLKSLEKFIIPELKKYDDVPLYIQEFFMYLLFIKYNCNTNDRNKKVLASNDYSKFITLVIDALMYIDNQIIWQTCPGGLFCHQFKIPRWLSNTFYNYKLKKAKAHQKIVIEKTFNGTMIGIKNNRTQDFIALNPTIDEYVNVKTINYRNQRLFFDCSTSLSFFMDAKDFEIYFKYDGKNIKTRPTHCYSLLKAFGETLNHGYSFSFDIDISNLNNSKLEAFAKIDGNDIKLSYKYSSVFSRLQNSKRSFWHYKDFMLENKQKYIVIKKFKISNLIKNELFFDLSKLKNVKNKKTTIVYIALRMIYYLTRPFYKNKHIWITFDKLYKAGDNGEYVYQYCLKNNRNVYYIIKKDSPDYERLIKQNKKRILVYNSLKAKLLVLQAEVILATHANIISYCSFDGERRMFIHDLFNAKVIQIQHGLTMQDIAQYQNRLFDNIEIYCCASKYEVQNLSQPIYDFDKKQLKLTGQARYDGLKASDKRIILISPTWRRNVVNSNVAHIKKQHNDNFRNSEYFKIYNSLINNKKLIARANENNYKLIYLLHPAMSAQINDYDKNDDVEILPGGGEINYEKMLSEASLMITDYSGVQYDFAYQRKAIIYYHPDKLSPHYGTSKFDYDKMGFGPICKNEKQIVDEICNYMKRNCKIKSIYKKRADDFFAFDDHKNCERIIAVVDQYLNDIK